ncbi:MAG: cytidylate kinase-like family protein [Candidatus Eremiobacteraeota bacterium]|nr:cytidylate kinase-like family protein [Candidatus Eremiobacteraeota bacterium]
MGVVTISNLYGSGAIDIAQRAAGLLGYTVVDRELPVVVAKRLQTSPEAVEYREDRIRAFGERVMSGLEVGTPEMASASTSPTFDEECLREVQHAVREFAAMGNTIIIGRAAHAILGRSPRILRVLMYAPKAWRVERVMLAAGCDERTARTEIERIDKARATYVREHYDIDWLDRTNFDLSIDTSSLGEDCAAELIATAARGR